MENEIDIQLCALPLPLGGGEVQNDDSHGGNDTFGGGALGGCWGIVLLFHLQQVMASMSIPTVMMGVRSIQLYFTIVSPM